MVLACSPCWTTLPLSSSWMFPSPHIGPSTSHCSPCVFLCLWICLFWTFHLHRFLQYSYFCVWFLSLSTVLSRLFHGIVCVQVIPLDGWRYSWCEYILYISMHRLMDVFVSCLWTILLLWAVMYKFLCRHMFLFLLRICECASKSCGKPRHSSVGLGHPRRCPNH